MMLLRAEPRCTTAIQTLKNKNAVMLNIIRWYYGKPSESNEYFWNYFYENYGK